jgi:hypothetical protein
LKRLFQHAACADEVIAFGETVPPFNVLASLQSLPGILDVTLETIPNQTPYLRAPVSKLRSETKSHGLRVGLAWAGNPGHYNDATRSLRLAELTPILAIPGVSFCSLQFQVPARDAADWEIFSSKISSQPSRDFLDSASLIDTLDLVISVDTAVAHLAGALACPVWTLIPESPDWRWLLNRTDSPWYLTMRLFRQTQHGGWAPVMARVAEELREWATTTTARAR